MEATLLGGGALRTVCCPFVPGQNNKSWIFRNV